MQKTSFLLFFATIFCLFHTSVIAQDDIETKTLFSGKGSFDAQNIGFFIAPAYSFSQIDNANVSLFNLRGGVTFKDKITFGGYFSTSLNQIMPESETLPNIYMDYWSAGGFVEYTVLSKKLVHVTFPLYVGYGEVQMDNEEGDAGLGESNFFQIEPSALLEINLHKYVRFNVGAGYRIVGNMEYRGFDQSNMSGLTGYVGLKFGLFR